MNHDLAPVKYATDDDVEAVAVAIELVDPHSSEHYARAAIAALEARGWKPPLTLSRNSV